MIYNKHLYVKRIREVAIRLDVLLNDVVFVGGAVVALYADDPAADEVRPTEDIVTNGIKKESKKASCIKLTKKFQFA